MSDILARIDRYLSAVVERFGPDVIVDSALYNVGNHGRDWWLGELAQRKPGHVIEIGTAFGVTAAGLALIANRVTTFDMGNFVDTPFPRVQLLDWPGSIHAARDAVLLLPEMCRLAGAGNVRSILIENDAEKAAIIAGTGADAAFVDGLHTEKAVLSDFAALQSTGFVSFHDVANKRVPGVLRAVERIGREVGGVRIRGNFAIWEGVAE